MESVAAFNNELSGLYDMRPPISKAKMAAITKSAMRAIKFYKHVVQSVEKFILKCKSEYKVPGLYVIDSIVRQSRHQFGPDKDVFAPRFARNIKETFINLFNCAPEDKSRIIRVLNLWQKNNVFAPDVIQPIFDLADPNNAAMYAMQTNSGSGPSGSAGDISTNIPNGLNTSGGNVSMDISMGSSSGMTNDDKVSGNLPDLSNNNLQQLLNDPNVLRQLQTLQNFQKFKQDDKQHMFNEMRLQEEAFEKHMHNVLKSNNNSGGVDGSDFHKEVEFVSEEKKIEVITLDGNDSRSPTPDRDRYKRRRSSRSRSRDNNRRDRDRDRDRDRERDRRRHSRSRSRTRSPRSSRRRSSRERDRSERNARDKEKERERRKKGLPDIKREHLSVCTTTLWVGHLSKLVYQEELSDTFGEFGDIVSIDQIVPRGCAFIVMNRRQDAHKAMQNLKNHKLQGRTITISWAAGKGVKSKEWKDYWDLELGCTYIPWNKLNKDTDFDSLEEGGMFDDDSMPGWMKDKINQMKSLKEKVPTTTIEHAIMQPPSANNLIFGIDTTQPPPGPPPPIMSIPTQYTMAPPRLPLGPPIGMPISGIPVHAIPNVPPPMVMPPNMIPPGYPPMPGQVDVRAPLGLSGINLPPGAPPQYPPPPVGAPAAAPIPPPSNDDQMDMDMDDEEVVLTTANSAQQSLAYNQPPPMIGMGDGVGHELGSNSGTDIFDRDGVRQAAGGSSRWSERAGEHDVDGHGMWRENGQVIGPPSANSFNDGRRGPPINFQPMDGMTSQQRQDFMNDFEGRGGPPRGAPPGHRNGGDFFPNMQQNRFNQPTSLLQMRIPPPNSFNARMVGPGGPVGPNTPGGPGGPPPMFMRGPGGPGPGNRQQGFFNPRNPFDRDGGRGGGRGGGRMSSRGGGRGNWSDEETGGDDGNFRRGGRGGPSNNRFRDRDEDNWHDRNRMGRRGGGNGDRFQRGGDRYDRNSRSGRDENRFENHNEENVGRRNSTNDENFSMQTNKNNDKTDVTNPVSDTEEDWDLELEDYDAKQSSAKNAALKGVIKIEQVELTDSPDISTNSRIDNDNSDNVNDKEFPVAGGANTTPLYDELPPPVTNVAAITTRTPPFEEEKEEEEAPKTIVESEPILEKAPTPPPEEPQIVTEDETKAEEEE